MAKLVIAAFVSPALTLLMSLPVFVRAKEAAIKATFQRPEYVDKKKLDSELAGLVMLMDLGIIFGFSLPIALPMLCLASALHLAVFNLAAKRLGQHITFEGKPAAHYLFISLAFGNGLNLWFFIDNSNQVVGQHLVYWGIPLGCIIGFFTGVVQHKRGQAALREAATSDEGDFAYIAMD